MKSDYGLENHGLTNLGAVYWNLPAPALYEEIVFRREGQLAHQGPVVVNTGKHTSRAATDKFIVHEPSSSAHVGWGEYNRPFAAEKFDALWGRLQGYLQGRDLFVQDCYAGADPDYRLPVRLVTELAWHSLFARNMFLRPATADEARTHVPEFTVVCAPGFKGLPGVDATASQTFIVLNFAQRLCVIGNTAYAGEIKKSVFTVMNYLLPAQGVLPMHCSANVDTRGDDTALFFGLSGTGKTTLSADPNRPLIGDDEHGWSDHGVFNFEGGCYAKVIRLSAAGEPEIYRATERFGTILENVVLDTVTRVPDHDDDPLTENTRSSYPLASLGNVVPTGLAGHPTQRLFPDRRRLRRAAAHRAADARPGDVPLPERLHGQGRRHRERRHRAAAHLLHLLRRALHAAPSLGLRQSAARPDRGAQGRLLARQHGLDRRRFRRRQPHADQGDPRRC